MFGQGVELVFIQECETCDKLAFATFFFPFSFFLIFFFYGGMGVQKIMVF